MKKILLRSIARTLLLTFTYQLIFPVYSFALTTGPSQPELESFEPVGTTEMVDMFTGDFNYNIPLLDVEGYPINIFYHSGISMEQEASWVGLGFNINPGEVNRSVRGIPDDFNGETIEKFTKVKEEKDIRIGMGANVMLEVFGKNLRVGAGSGIYVNHNNYRGVSAGITTNVAIKTPALSFGVNVGIGSQTGADIDLNASANLSTKHFEDGARGNSIGGSLGAGFNSRTGLKDLTLGVKFKNQVQNKNLNTYGAGVGTETTIPVGIQNYVPVIANQIVQNAYAMQLKAGVEFSGGYGGVYVDAMVSSIKYQSDGSRPGYGYLYAENANKESIMDFSRDKDGVYNATMQNLPLSANTYDIYTVNGQGTGGMFRPFRNDIGTIYDPYVSPSDESDNYSVMLEAGIGNLFEAGSDLSTLRTRNECGPWSLLAYGGTKPGTLYEKFFFKNGGDISYNQQQEASQIYNPKPTYVSPDMQRMKTKGGSGAGTLPNGLNGTTIFWNNSVVDRSSRAIHIGYQTAEQAQKIPETDQSKKIISYENGVANNFYDPKMVTYNRHNKTTTGGDNHNAAPHHISEFTQTLSDGRRYIYGIPAINNVSREVTFAIDEARANWNNGCVGFNPGTDDGLGNTKGKDNLYSTSNTPAYTHSYLLTSVLSDDYVDILGDGQTDDDLGSFTKINYTLKDKDYRWRTPYSKDSAQFDPGFRSDTKDGKGHFISGSRQQWNVRSIESKNYIAEFYTSKRKDGLGIKEAVLQTGSKINNASMNFTATKADSSFSYKLDSIVLYNKHDRYVNKANAIAIKTVVFQYDYSLCPNTPNSVDPSKGKLTLRKLFIKYGNSHKNLLSPYVFDYNASNPAYNFAAKDRWGNYKELTGGTNNYDFPYCFQPSDAETPSQNLKLAAWNLTDIKLPSGGKIHVDFESDDYSFVQDKRAMQMLKIEGVGGSTSFEPKDILYSDESNINDYVYFKRRKDKERAGVSMKDNYLEDQEIVYYSFDLDVTGKGNYEFIKGFAKFDEVGYCDNNPSSDYGYIKLKRENVKGMSLHPAVVLGINTARYYLPHIFFDGYQENSDIGKVIQGLFSSGEELINTLILQNPFKRFINQKKSKSIKLPNSFLRVQTPNLTKRGGGLRVQKLTLSDNWNNLSGGQNALYGKNYDYTFKDPSGKYGIISSGVASYEPMIGGDENPFRKPVPYSADKGRLLPSVDFYQLEPFGESYFPGATVGYQSVKVTSIHQDYGRSAQAMDEHLFYTAKDFPVRIDFTNIDGNRDGVTRDLTHYYKETELMQGYALVLNDMHGKQKAVNNYTRQKDGAEESFKKITGVEYKYRTDAGGSSLDNNVDVILRKRGTINTYELRKAKLGEDVDLSIDSRQRKTDVKMTNTELNLNVFVWGIFPLFTFSVFHAPKQKTISFKSLVTTKIIQQYGMIKTIEQFDHDAKTTTENLVYDGETGAVLLSKTSNQYKDNIYSRRDPAYWAYEGMMPSYTNADYEEMADSLVVDDYREGLLYTNNLSRFSPGDELLVKYNKSGSDSFMKLWVMETGRQANKTSVTNLSVYKSDFLDLGTNGTTTLFQPYLGTQTINIKNSSGTTVYTGTLTNFYSNATGRPEDLPSCSAANILRYNLSNGSYTFEVKTGSTVEITNSFTISPGKSVNIDYYKFSGVHVTNVFKMTKDVNPCVTVITPPGRCALVVTPRYRDFNVSGVNKSTWPIDGRKFAKVMVKVLRSGRRNNTGKSVQELQFAHPATSLPFFTDLGSYMGKTNNVISSSVTTYSDNVVNYSPFTNTVFIPGIGDYSVLNKYVLGLKGNFRPLAAYAPIAKRTYDKAHSRYDGTYSIDQKFWTFQNGYTTAEPSCAVAKNILLLNTLSGTSFWKRSSSITKYDPNGNALEEQDAIGVYSSAQYGYNGLLPISVASNVRAQFIMFDGFEEYDLLNHQTTSALYKSSNRLSVFSSFFKDVISVTSAYPSEQPSGEPSVFNRHGQRYQLRNKTSALGIISTDASHTGLYSLKFTTTKQITIKQGSDIGGFISPYTIPKTSPVMISFWVKSTNPSVAIPFNLLYTKLSTDGSPNKIIERRTNSIDGWFLMETEVDLTNPVLTDNLIINFPANVFVDDVRIMPAVSNMKSFVYDPISLKLIAQLDENHFATFYEYDQEGLLIRTKKETNKGIITISESRRANSKLP